MMKTYSTLYCGDQILAVVILTLSLTTAFTGVLLAFYYEPTAGGAYNSLKVIATEIPNGWLVQRLHILQAMGYRCLSSRNRCDVFRAISPELVDSLD